MFRGQRHVFKVIRVSMRNRKSGLYRDLLGAGPGQRHVMMESVRDAGFRFDLGVNSRMII